MDILAKGFNVIKTHKRVGKRSCTIKPVSKLLVSTLTIMRDKGYISSLEVKDNGRGGELEVKGLGPINNCGVIKPRFSVGAGEWVKWEQRYILSKDFGMLIVSTPEGLMANSEAKQKGIGGRLIAYVY